MVPVKTANLTQVSYQCFSQYGCSGASAILSSPHCNNPYILSYKAVGLTQCHNW